MGISPRYMSIKYYMFCFFYRAIGRNASDAVCGARNALGRDIEKAISAEVMEIMAEIEV